MTSHQDNRLFNDTCGPVNDIICSVKLRMILFHDDFTTGIILLQPFGPLYRLTGPRTTYKHTHYGMFVFLAFVR